MADSAVNLLAGEAFRVIRIKQNPWTVKVFEHVFRTYRAAESVDAPACYAACGESERAILAAQSNHWSLLYLELDKRDLPIEEFSHEVFRNIGAMVESFLFPHLRELLMQVRILRDKQRTGPQVAGLKLGNVVGELHKTLGLSELVAPPPWQIRLNQWRNIAQHYRSVVRGESILAYYGVPGNEIEISFNRSELMEAVKTIYSICEAVSAARTLFVIDNIKKISRYFPGDLILRDDARIFSLATAISTQGFNLAELQVTDQSVTATIAELSNGAPQERMIHASQFAYPIWLEFQTREVVVRYKDKKGQIRLITKARGEDCRKIADGLRPFHALAGLFEFTKANSNDSDDEIA